MVEGLRLYLDVQAIQNREHWERGVARYAAQHASALTRISGVVARAALNPSLPEPVHVPPELLEQGVVWNTAAEFRRARDEGPIAYVLMSPFHLDRPLEASLPPHALEHTTPFVSTLYDLIPRISARQYLGDLASARFYRSRERMLEHSDLVLALSQASARDAERLLGIPETQLAVIGGGVSDFYRPPTNRAEGQRQVREAFPGISRPFVLALSFPDPRKNIETLIRGFARLPPSVREERQLVVAGRSSREWRERLGREAQHAGLRSDEMVLTGLVSDAQLRSLYQSAELFVNPSRYEGFGLPVLEAVACGCPTIVADAASLPEILEWPRATFPTEDDGALAALMSRALVDETFRDELRRVGEQATRRHSWDNVAQRTVDAVRSAAFVSRARRRRSRPPTRRRVAFLGRAEPGLAEQASSRALVRALARVASVELFSPGSRTNRDRARAQLPEDVGVHPLEALGVTRVLEGFDLVIDGLVADPSEPAAVRTREGVARVPWIRDVAALPGDGGRLADHPVDVVAVLVDDPAVRDLVLREDDAANVVVVAPSLAAPGAPTTGLTLAVVGPATPPATAVDWLEDALTGGDGQVVVTGPFDSAMWRALRTAAESVGASGRLTLVEVVDDLELSAWITRAERVVDLSSGALGRAVEWLAARHGAERVHAGASVDVVASELVALATRR